MYLLYQTKASAILFVCLQPLLLWSFSGVVNIKVDSLKEAIAEETADTSKYHLYTALATELIKNDRTQVGLIYEEQLALAKKINNKDFIAQTNEQIGANYLQLGENEKARNYIVESIDYYRQSNNLRKLTGGLNNLALVYQRSNHYACHGPEGPPHCSIVCRLYRKDNR